jgi:hypothetical protein
MKKTKIDRRQTLLIPKEKTRMEPETGGTAEFASSAHERVFCPFCIHVDELQSFLIPGKRGAYLARAKCPECGKGMLVKTLTREFTPEQFAEWVYKEYGVEFWRKVTFKLFTKRLYDMGWSYRFWRRYKELKGESPEQQYEAYVKDTQERGSVDT